MIGRDRQVEAAMNSSLDVLSPQEIAGRVRAAGVNKARTDTLTLFVLAILAGAFIAFGSIFYVVVVTESHLGFGLTRLIGGLAFSLGLVLVLVGGAELFTGNNLIAMAWVSGLVSLREILRNWAIVYVGNVLGCLGMTLLVVAAETHGIGDGAVGKTVLAIGRHKAGLEFLAALSAGVLCNVLVCLAVWLSMGGRSAADKILAIVFPVTAFVTIGFEHSIANWFFLPWAGALGATSDPGFTAAAAINLVTVTIGNIIGGTLLVAGVYWLAYLRPGREPTGS